MTDKMSKMGYKDNSPYRQRPYIPIYSPSGILTMNGVSNDLLVHDLDTNEKRILRANSGNHSFNGKRFMEYKLQSGGYSWGSGNYQPSTVKRVDPKLNKPSVKTQTAHQEARNKVKAIYDSPGYQQKLRNEIQESNKIAPGYSRRNTYNQIQGQRQNRIDNTPIGLMENKDYQEPSGLFTQGLMEPFIHTNGDMTTSIRVKPENYNNMPTLVEELDHSAFYDNQQRNVTDNSIVNERGNLVNTTLTPYANSILYKNRVPKQEWDIDEHYNYITKPVEMVGKKRVTESYLIDKSLLKPGDKITDEHFNYLYDNYRDLPSNVQQFINSTYGSPLPKDIYESVKNDPTIKKDHESGKKRIMEVMNKIADSNKTNEFNKEQAEIKQAKQGGYMYNNHKPTDKKLWNYAFSKAKLKYGGYAMPDEIHDKALEIYSKKKGGWIISFQKGGGVNNTLNTEPSDDYSENVPTGKYNPTTYDNSNRIAPQNRFGAPRAQEDFVSTVRGRLNDRGEDAYAGAEIGYDPESDRVKYSGYERKFYDTRYDKTPVNPVEEATNRGQTLDEYTDDAMADSRREMGVPTRGNVSTVTRDMTDEELEDYNPIRKDKSGLDVLKETKRIEEVPYEPDQMKKTTVIQPTTKYGGDPDLPAMGPDMIEGKLKSQDSGNVLTPHASLKQMGYWGDNGWTPQAKEMMSKYGISESEMNALDYNDIAANLDPKGDGLDKVRAKLGEVMRNEIKDKIYGNTSTKLDGGGPKGDMTRFAKDFLFSEAGYPKDMPVEAQREFNTIKRDVEALSAKRRIPVAQAYQEYMTTLGTEDEMKGKYPNAFGYQMSKFQGQRTGDKEIKRNQYATVDVETDKGKAEMKGGSPVLDKVNGSKLTAEQAFAYARKMGYDYYWYNGEYKHSKRRSELGVNQMGNKPITPVNVDKFSRDRDSHEWTDKMGRTATTVATQPGYAKPSPATSAPATGSGSVKTPTIRSVSKKQTGGYLGFNSTYANTSTPNDMDTYVPGNTSMNPNKNVTYQNGGELKYKPGQMIRYQKGGMIHTGTVKSYDPMTGNIELH